MKNYPHLGGCYLPRPSPRYITVSSLCIILRIRLTSSSAHLIIAQYFFLFVLFTACTVWWHCRNKLCLLSMYVSPWKRREMEGNDFWCCTVARLFLYRVFFWFMVFSPASRFASVLFANFWSRFACVLGQFPNCFRLISDCNFGSSHEKFYIWPGL